MTLDSHDLYSAARWWVAIFVGLLAVVLAVASSAVLMRFYGQEVAIPVQVLLIGVVPALSLTAIFVARAASDRVRRVRWSTYWILLIGVSMSCAAHLTWNSALAADDGHVLTSGWVIPILLTVSTIGLGAASLAFPSLPKSLTFVARTLVGTVVGLAIALVCVAFLAVPGAGVILSAVAFTIILVLRRRDRRPMDQLSSA